MDSINNLKEKLVKAAQTKKPYKRAALIATLISEALHTINQDPILVGGAAVEFYTQGGYSTADIDMITIGGSDLPEIMSQLGFKKLGKDYIHQKLKIYIEFPGRALGATEQYREVQIEGLKLKIISVEDLIVDRLAAFKFWKSEVDGINVLLLLELEDLNQNHLEQRAKEEQVMDALEILQNLREEIIRKKIPKEKATQLLNKTLEELK